MNLPDAAELIRFHDLQLLAGPTNMGIDGPLLAAIADNHRCNILLWETEDQARRTDVPDDYIVRCKRQIDRHNQQRNDAVERIDEVLFQALPFQALPLTPANIGVKTRLHSETPGAIIDRLSILSLKIHHMGLQTQRSDADAAHISTCDAKLQVLRTQRADLATCLSQLMNEFAHGEARFKMYRQFKMYNDPALNPWLKGKPAA